MKSKNGLLHLLIVGEVIILILILVLGMARKMKGPKVPKDAAVTQNTGGQQRKPAFGAAGVPDGEKETEASGAAETEAAETKATEETESGQPEEEETRETFSEEIEDILAGMTPEQKVAQLFIVSPETLTGADQVTIAGEGTRTALTNYPVGGMVYGSGNYMGVPQMQALITNAQNMSMEVSGQYLFAAMSWEPEGGQAVLAAAKIGQEEQLGSLLNPQAALDGAALEGLIQFPLYQNQEALMAAPADESLKCFQAGPGGEGAVEAVRGGAQMLLVREGFAEAYEKVYEAVDSQAISEMTLDEAVGRILTEKQAISGQAENNE